MKKCRLCYSNNIKNVLTLNNMPSNISILYNKAEDLVKDIPITFEIFQCLDCELIQADENKGINYYDDYVMTVSHSKKMNDYQKKQAIDFVDKYNLKGKKIIEVGCGDGNFMNYLQELGVNVSGIEPSNNFRKLAQNKGLNVFSGYATEGKIIEGGPYEGFVTREVLEHVPDINDFLKGVYYSLDDNAVGLIEVPCMEKTFRDNRFYDFFPDHVNYFTEKTLKYALTKNGFVVIDFFYGMDKEFSNVIVKKERKINFNNISKVVNNLSNEINKFSDFFNKKNLKIGIWGAGAKGLTVLAVSKVKNIEFIIDSDNYKVNKYSPISHIKIVNPEYVNKLDAILITAMAYEDEIIKNLNEQYHFKGTIATLGENLKIIVDKHNLNF